MIALLDVGSGIAGVDREAATKFTAFIHLAS
jgi:hypothetical protein